MAGFPVLIQLPRCAGIGQGQGPGAGQGGGAAPGAALPTVHLRVCTLPAQLAGSAACTALHPTAQLASCDSHAPISVRPPPFPATALLLDFLSVSCSPPPVFRSRNRALDAFEAVLTREAAALQQHQLQQQLLEEHAQEQLQQQQQQQEPGTDTMPSPQRTLSPAGGLTAVPTTQPPDLRLVEVSLGALANLIAVRPREAAAALAGRGALLGLLLAAPAGAAAAAAGGGGCVHGSGGFGGDGIDALDGKARARDAEGGGDGAAAGPAAPGGVAGGGAGGAAGSVEAPGGGLLFVDDSRVLGELCRLGSLALRAEVGGGKGDGRRGLSS